MYIYMGAANISVCVSWQWGYGPGLWCPTCACYVPVSAYLPPCSVSPLLSPLSPVLCLAHTQTNPHQS